MRLQEVLAILFISCIFSAVGKTLPESNDDFTLKTLKNEIKRFTSIKDTIEKINLNVSIIFSKSANDEDGTPIKHDSLEFRPITSEYNPKGRQLPEIIKEDEIKDMLKFAEELGADITISREKFLPDGSLSSKLIFAEDVKIHYEDGSSSIRFEDKKGELESDDNAVEELLSIIRDYELPVQTTKYHYGENGETLIDITAFFPQRVKIVKSQWMDISMQLTAAEALKRCLIIKAKPSDRINLLCKFLGIQFPEYTFEAAIGEGQHYYESSSYVVLQLQDQTYTIWANIAE